MKYYEIWKNPKGIWEVFEVTEYGQCYCLYKTFKTEKGAKGWARRQWYRVIWR